MTALASDRPVKKIGAGPIPNRLSLLQKGSTTIYQGALVVLNAGYAAPGSTATSLTAVGVATSQSDNANGSDGDVSVEVESGVFPFKNSASTDAIAQAQVGSDCYVVDDQTVAKTDGSSTRSKAGKIVAVDANFVYVLVGLTV